MNTFTYIANKLFIKDIQYKNDINIQNLHSFSSKTYISHIFENMSDDTHINFIKSCFIFSNKTKFNNLTIQYIDNHFINHEQRRIFIDFFYHIQKIYWAFNRFARQIKIKNYNLKVHNDLFLSPISITQKNTFSLFENNCIYLFTLQDLSRIIISSICNSPDFCAEPVKPKNPYSGVEFTTATLYNIYFKMKEQLLVVPNIIQQYFLCNFDIDDFFNNNQSIIRSHYISKFVNNEDEDIVIDYIYEMLQNYPIKIHCDFPKKILIDAFKHILPVYLFYKYSVDNTIRNKYSKIFSCKIRKFIQVSPRFGRRILSFANRKRYVSFVTIDGNTEKTPYNNDDMSITNSENDNEDNDNEDVSSGNITSNILYNFTEPPDLTSSIEAFTISRADIIQNIIDPSFARLMLDTAMANDEDTRDGFIDDDDLFDSDDEIIVDESLYDP